MEERPSTSSTSQKKAKALELVCWSAVLGSCFLTAAFSHWMNGLLWAAAQPGSPGIWCGNTITAPFGLMLNCVIPAGVIAIAPLGLLWRRGFATGRSLSVASCLVLACSGWLVVFGTRVFDEYIGFSLADLVWWM